MGIFGKFLGKKAGAVKAEVKKLENRDLLEAVVGGCLLIAAADGDIEDSEVKKIDSLLRTNKNLEHFGSEITELVNRFSERLQSGYRVARAEIVREIEDIKGDQQHKEDVLLNMLTIAEADGEIEPAEQKELDTVAQRLGLRISDYV